MLKGIVFAGLLAALVLAWPEISEFLRDPRAMWVLTLPVAYIVGMFVLLRA
ncbi:MAG TPA: hypothetical protein VMX97_01780 [Hyphomicrobiaceae bacterium]|nr:hypothetical protein [Hyphomicrobiaceae bacterium]